MTEVKVNKWNKAAYEVTAAAEGITGLAGLVYGVLNDSTMLVPAGVTLMDTYCRTKLLKQVEEGEKGKECASFYGQLVSDVAMPLVELVAGGAVGILYTVCAQEPVYAAGGIALAMEGLNRLYMWSKVKDLEWETKTSKRANQ